MTLHITSLQNPRIKNIIALDKPRERKTQGLFVVEGVREVSLCQQAGFSIQAFYTCPGLFAPDAHYPIDSEGAEHYTVSSEVFARIAYRESTGGVVAVVALRPTALEHLPKGAATPLYLVLEKVEKPGNIGAMLRTADAAGLSGVIVCDPATDFFNPNVIRSSVGTVFTVPVASATNAEALQWFRERGIRTYAAALQDSFNYLDADYSAPAAIVLGSEADGLSDFWMLHSDARIRIPMQGKIDSMNVSNAAAILIFEALRQRRNQ